MGVYRPRPSHLILTGFVAGHGHSSGRQLDARSSGPSVHRWYRWHYHGSQGWASRLGKERLRGAAEGHHARIPHPQHMQATRVLGLLAQESFFSLQVSFSMYLEGASIRLGVAKAQHLQTRGQIFLTHAALCFPGLAHRRHLDAHYHHQGPRASSLPSTLRSMNCIPTARILSSFFTPLPRKTRLCECRPRLSPAPCSRRLLSSMPLSPQLKVGEMGEAQSLYLSSLNLQSRVSCILGPYINCHPRSTVP